MKSGSARSSSAERKGAWGSRGVWGSCGEPGKGDEAAEDCAARAARSRAAGRGEASRGDSSDSKGARGGGMGVTCAGVGCSGVSDTEAPLCGCDAACVAGGRSLGVGAAAACAKVESGAWRGQEVSAALVRNARAGAARGARLCECVGGGRGAGGAQGACCERENDADAKGACRPLGEPPAEKVRRRSVGLWLGEDAEPRHPATRTSSSP